VTPPHFYTRMSKAGRAIRRIVKCVLLRRNVAKALRDEATAGLPANRVFPGPSQVLNVRQTARVSIEERRGQFGGRC
jgi:hypothetical protein